MKKCVATCIYRGKTMVNFSVNCKGAIIVLANKPKEYVCFTRLTEACLALLENNGFYVDTQNLFGKTFYNIQFINLDNPAKVFQTFIDKEVM